MRCYFEMKERVRTVDVGRRRAQIMSAALIAVDGSRDWDPVVDEDLETLVQDMVKQLPREDAEIFLRTAEKGFRSKSLSSGLTASIVQTALDDDTTSLSLRVRIFVAEGREAELPAIGLEVGNLLLQALPTMKFAAMVIWQARRRDAVLEGDILERTPFRSFVADNAASMALLVLTTFLFVALLAAAIVEQESGRSFIWFGDGAREWFKRLLGPLGAALAAAFVALLVDFQRGRVRRAFWNLGQR